MKKTSSIIQWILTGFLGLCALVNGFHWSSLLFILAGVLFMPLPAIYEAFKKIKLKKGFVIALAAIVMLVGMFNSPLGESKPNTDSGVTSSDTYEGARTTTSDTSGAESGTTDSTGSTSINASEQDKIEVNSSVGTGKAKKPSLSSIPAYSGNPYVKLNNGIPNFSSAELTTKGYEKYGTLDSLGRVTAAIASLGKETMPGEDDERGSISNIKPTGWVQKQYDNVSGKYLYNRCHLIGWQLSAENANRNNLITGTKYFNVTGMFPFENMVADYINETGNHVAYRVTPIFEGDNLLSNGVQIEAYSIEDKGEGIQFNVFVYNVQPDININYATGDSSSNVKPETNTPPATTEKEDTSSSSAPPVQSQEEMVWIPTKGGTKYHSRSNCSNMIDPDYVTKDYAISQGFEACKRCH